MNTDVDENTRLSEDFVRDSGHYSPPHSKRLRIDENNLNTTLNNESKKDEIWPRPGEVEPEVLVDLGVSMLEDENDSCESIKKSQCNEQSSSPSSSECSRPLHDCEKPNLERLQENQTDEPAVFCLDNANDIDQFYLFRRKKKPSFTGEDKFNTLSDEVILSIFKWLPKKCLVRSMLVCKRWCMIARDEALWTRLDLGSKVLAGGTLGHILPRGVQILRLAQAELADPVLLENSFALSDDYSSKLQYLDLSMAVISASGLASVLFKCKSLKKLSLENCVLNEACCEAIGQNSDIIVLNLAMCGGINAAGVKHLMKLESLSALNVAWCLLESDAISLLCKSLPRSLTRLNISGCRKTIIDDDVKDLVISCPSLVELDLSDCILLTSTTAQSIANLKKLEHLSLSRCYSIPASTYLRLACMPSVMYLDLFGLMGESMLKTLQANTSGTELNKFHFSSVARPTVGVRRTSIWGLRVRD